MNASRIVRIQVANATQDYVVLQSNSIGPEALDLQLVGTDEEAAYVGSIKHNAHAELRSNPVNINNDDWTCALSSVFAPNDHMAPKADIEVLAKVDADRMTLIIRKNVQSITVSLVMYGHNIAQISDAIAATSWRDHTSTRSRHRNQTVRMGSHRRINHRSHASHLLELAVPS